MQRLTESGRSFWPVIVAFLSFLAFEPHTYARPSLKASSSNWYGKLGVGVIDHDAGLKYSDPINGTHSLTAEIYPQLTFESGTSLNSEWSTQGLLLLSYPEKSSPEGNQKTSVDVFELRLTNQYSDWLRLHFGATVLYYIIQSSSGTVPLSNGAGTTNFYTPSSKSTSTLLGFNIGSEFTFETYSIDFGIICTGLSPNSKFSINPVLTIKAEVY